MEILPPPLQAYLDAHCDPEPEMLITINRETHVKVLKPHMLSGHYQGRLLSMLSKMLQPKCILEIGTYTGYATICLAEGLAEGGEIHTIEVNLEMEEMIRKNFKNSGFEKKFFHILVMLNELYWNYRIKITILCSLTLIRKIITLIFS